MDWIRNIIKLVFVVVGVVGIYLMLNDVIKQTNDTIRTARDNNASAYIVSSYISNTPFGEATNQVKRHT